MSHRGLLARLFVVALIVTSFATRAALAETDASATEAATTEEAVVVSQGTKDLSDPGYTYARFEVHAFAYTGSAIKPVPTVIYSNGPGFDTLKEGTDFTLTYQDTSGTTIASPTAVGIYSVTITGMGSYSGTCNIHPRFAIANSEGGLLYCVGTDMHVEESAPDCGTGAYVVGVTDGATSATLPKQLGGSDIVSFDIIRDKSLTSIDASAATSIAYIGCGTCSLSSLVLPSTNTLKKIDCHSNKLTTLNVSALPALDELICYSNDLDTLDVSKNTSLTCLNVVNNYIHGDALAALIKPAGGQAGITPQNDLLDLSKSEISGVEPTYDYTGSAIAPVPTVTYNDTTVDPEDYSVTYLDAAGNVVSSPTEPGTYTLTVSGTDGIYTGSTSTTFEILAPAATTSATTSIASVTPVTAATTGTPATGDSTIPWLPAVVALGLAIVVTAFAMRRQGQ